MSFVPPACRSVAGLAFLLAGMAAAAEPRSIEPSSENYEAEVRALIKPFETAARSLAASLNVAADLFRRVERDAKATGRSELATEKVLRGLKTLPGADFSTRLSLLEGEANAALADLSGAERVCADPSSPRANAALAAPMHLAATSAAASSLREDAEGSLKKTEAVLDEAVKRFEVEKDTASAKSLRRFQAMTRSRMTRLVKAIDLGLGMGRNMKTQAESFAETVRRACSGKAADASAVDPRCEFPDLDTAIATLENQLAIAGLSSVCLSRLTIQACNDKKTPFVNQLEAKKKEKADKVAACLKGPPPSPAPTPAPKPAPPPPPPPTKTKPPSPPAGKKKLGPPRPVKTLQPSKKGLKLIQCRESADRRKCQPELAVFLDGCFPPNPRCKTGTRTIGFGHRLTKDDRATGEVFGHKLTRRELKAGKFGERKLTKEEVATRLIRGIPWKKGISGSQAQAIFNGDIAVRVTELKRRLGPKVMLNQNQFDALVDLIYNVGGPALKISTVFMKVKRGDLGLTAEDFIMARPPSDRFGKGLAVRSQSEIDQWRDPFQ